MTLFTLRNEKKVANIPLLVYIGVTIFCAIFGIIYEFNAHNVFSNSMMFGFMWPLFGGVVFYTFLKFVLKNYLPSQAASYAYNCGLATLTVGCYFKGVIEIYGTTREKYVILYTVVGIVLMSAALIFYAYGVFLKLRQQKNEN